MVQVSSFPYYQRIVRIRRSTSFSVKLQKFIASDLWPPNSPDLNPVDYRIRGVTQDCVYQTPVQDVTDLKH